MIDHERTIASTRAKIGAVLGVRAFVTALSVWLLTWGTIALVLRAALATPREPLAWGALGILGAAAFGGVVAHRKQPTIAAVRALLDGHWRCGGLLMAAGDTDTSGWSLHNSAVSAAPRVAWNGRRQCGILSCCALFALFAFVVPARFLEQPNSQRLVVADEVEKLAAKIEVLKEENILPPQKAEALEQALDELERDAAGNDPSKTWEALDHLEQALAKAAAEAAEDKARAAEKAAQAEELASALDDAHSQMAAAELAKAMKLLAEDVQLATKESESLDGALAEAMKQLAEGGELAPAQLAELAQALGNCKGGNLATLGRLCEARLIDPSMLAQLRGQCEIDPDALAALLAACDGEGFCLSDALAQCNKPGRGGINRGRGDAAMTWTDGASAENTQFKEKVLPPGAVASVKDSTLQGVSIGDPTADTPAETTAGGALDTSNAGRGSARTQVILPEHRKAVQRYFARETQGRNKASEAP
ncbi:MAG TPA: hypothetical protein VHD36_04140 [Pirellulales bacterium]|nr:hypothetical protein [Pirellulales bacterium]